MNANPQLDDLRLLCVVARHRSFAETARELGVSKAVVSKRIALLEAAVQERLFHRTTRSVSLTAQGEIVYQWAQRILEDVDLMGEAISREKAAPSGLLRICSSTGFGRSRLAPALSALAVRYPQLEIQVELFDRLVDLVEEGFQLDIRIGRVREGNVIKRRIARNRRVLCASPAYLARFGTPGSLDELKAHRCIPIRERDQDSGVGSWTARRGVSPSRSAARSRPTMARSSASGPSTATASSCAPPGTSVTRSTPACWCRYCPGISSRPMSGPSIPHACRCRPRSRCVWSFWRRGSRRRG